MLLVHLSSRTFLPFPRKSDKSPNQATAAQRFWDAFKACLEENRIWPDRSHFYVKWAQAFVDYLPGYTSARAFAPETSGWVGGIRTKSSPFREHVVPGEVERLFSSLLHALKTEVKGRYDAVGERTL